MTKNLKDLIGSIDRYNYRYACLCTDDSHPDDLIKNGGVDNAVREAVQMWDRPDHRFNDGDDECGRMLSLPGTRLYCPR